MVLRLVLCLSFLALAACQAENSIVLRDVASSTTPVDNQGAWIGLTPIENATSTHYRARYTVGEPMVGPSGSTHYKATVGVRRD